jgi:Outer membrane protein beta-barrel domain
MKKVLLSLAAVAVAGGLMAQENRASLGLEVALPMGTFGTGSGIGFGGSAGYEIPVGDNLGALAQVGFLSFSGKDQSVLGVTVKGASTTMIPIQIGGKYYLTDNQEGFYLGALLGVHMVSSTIPATSTTYFGVTVTTPEVKANSTGFSFAPMVGYMVSENIDLGVRYQIVSASGGSSSYLGLRAAYMFGGR